MLMAVVALLLAADVNEVAVGSPVLSYVGMSQAQGDVYVDYFTQQLALQGGIRVTTRAENVAAMITGSLAASTSGFVITLKVLRAGGGTRAIALYSDRVRSEDALFELLKNAAKDLAVTLRKTFLISTPGASVRPLWWIPALVGGALLAGGGITFGIAKSQEGLISRADKSITTREQLASLERDAPILQTIGFGVGAAGIAALLLGVSFALFGDEPPPIAFELRPGSGTVFVNLRWP